MCTVRFQVYFSLQRDTQSVRVGKNRNASNSNENAFLAEFLNILNLSLWLSHHTNVTCKQKILYNILCNIYIYIYIKLIFRVYRTISNPI